MSVLLLTTLAAATIALRADAAPLDPQTAAHMTPAALGDALLAPGHPAVIDATVGPQGVGPPPPPGSYATPITLYLKAVPSEAAGFCEQIVATVRLLPAPQLGEGRIAPSAPNTVTQATAFRWIGRGAPTATCDAERSRFFSPDADAETSSLDMVRRLVALRDTALRGGRLPANISVEDRLGDQTPTGPQLVTDPRRALAALPIEDTNWVGPSSRSVGRLLGGDWEQGTTFDMGGVWTTVLVFVGDRISTVRMKRELPPPF